MENRDQLQDWQELCKAAACEADPEKLLKLIGQLTRALDQRDTRPTTGRESMRDQSRSASGFRTQATAE